MRIVKGVIIFMIVFCVTLLVAYFLFPVKIELYNVSFKITASYLNLSKIKIQDIDELKRKLSLFRKAKIVDLGNNYLTIDGVKAKFDDGFALVRASNTGPNLTLRFEATTESRLKEIEEEFTSELKRCINEIK